MPLTHDDGQQDDYDDRPRAAGEHNDPVLRHTAGTDVKICDRARAAVSLVVCAGTRPRSVARVIRRTSAVKKEKVTIDRLSVGRIVDRLECSRVVCVFTVCSPLFLYPT